ncbi:MAG: sensor histidine kinase [Solobacterium sp.]|nr:sensor histidine kinase [Solobacterium sp.]MCI7446285.1 sensor histidine kinase [Solobacterium sp.]MDD7775338.1 sensor histidine kinase [Solobacterium sp.]MDY2953884.1 sensor histidine kinase [Erysipelotrichaceae bacterium]
MVQNYNSYIDEKDLPYIFERFYRSDKSRQNDGKSFGLGLAITKEMVDKLNGEIKI